jgi:ATP-dependent protease HslVU (ClpYQ) peptidase subunit
MTTLTVVRKNGVAAIAADTLIKWGNVKESATYMMNNDKIVRVKDSYIAISGPTAGQLALRDFFAAFEDEVRLESIPAIYRTWLVLHKALKHEYFMNPNEGSNGAYETSRINVLIANPHGIFGVASDRVVQEFSRFYAYGRGCEYALGAMYAVYDDPARSAEDIARLGIEASAEFDDSTGLPIISYAVQLNQEQATPSYPNGSSVLAAPIVADNGTIHEHK